MHKNTNQWQIAERIPAEIDQALGDLPPYLRQILYNRGIRDAAGARTYLECIIPDGCAALQIKGMPEAVARILAAIDGREQIAVYGDYDVDGVTATALLVEALRALGANVLPYIPNRFEEGYGLNGEALHTLAGMGVRLVITVDCGIRSMREAVLARELGLDMIITDHHHCLDEIPSAVAVINPRQPGDNYPEKELAGVGLAYKLVQALLETRPVAMVRAEDWLDLVALGTVADMAVLAGENRSLVRAGLERIRQRRRQGLQSLAGAAELNLEKVTAGDIGFILGPRLNAAGRLESAQKALDLLIARDAQTAGELALYLNERNMERQKMTRDIQARVEAMVFATQQDTHLIFACDPDFNHGVVGLAASRLTDQYYRPAIVAHRAEEYTRASCRSIPGFHITQALDQCADLLEKHGGHAAAAGFTVRNDRLDELIGRLQALAVQQLGDLDALHRTLRADLEIPLNQLHFDMFQHLRRLEPTGFGNPGPLFVTRNLRVLQARQLGQNGQHLRLSVTDGRGTRMNAIAFRMGDRLNSLGSQVDLLYAFEPNEYRGTIEPQLNVRDIRLAQE